jgi:uncharacterized protein with von Willebrand factor type A (vWA) domain
LADRHDDDLGEMSFSRRDIFKVLDDEEVRKVLSLPRKVPRKVREDIAKIIIEDMRSGFQVKDIRRFTQRFGAFYPMMSYLKEMEQWRELKTMTEGNQVAQALVLIHLLPAIYDLIETLPRAYRTEAELDEKVKDILKRFETLMEETMALWGGALPGAEDIDWAEVDRSTEILLKEDQFGIIEEMIRRFLDEMMGGLVDAFKDELELLETLYLLFPGRFWDYSRRELHKTFLGDLEGYAKRLRQSQLRDILDLLGRIDIEYNAKRTDLTHHGSSEVYSVHTSSDLKHLLPGELVKLKDPVLKNLFLAQLVEGKLLTYQLRGKNWDGTDTIKESRKGPVIALVDTSGSMMGAPELTAKAIVLAAAKKLMKEKRDIKVILFSSIGQTTSIELTDRNKMARHFLDFLQMSFGGGTDFNTALYAGVQSLRDGLWKDADLLFITDGYSILSDQALLDEWKAQKAENGVRAFTIIIGNDTSGGLTPISDRTFYLKRAGSWDIGNSPAKLLRLL